VQPDVGISEHGAVRRVHAVVQADGQDAAVGAGALDAPGGQQVAHSCRPPMLFTAEIIKRHAHTRNARGGERTPVRMGLLASRRGSAEAGRSTLYDANQTPRAARAAAPDKDANMGTHLK
jgi:hypothetical protein